MYIIILINTVIFIFKLLAILTGISYYTKLRNTYWKWLTWFLIFKFVTDIIRNYMSYKYETFKGLRLYLWLCYHIQEWVTFSFFIWLFYKWFPPGRLKKRALTGLIIYLVTSVFEIGFYDNPRILFGILSHGVAMIILSLLSIMYYAAIVKSPGGIYYYQDPMFWFVTGIMLWYHQGLHLYVYQNDISNLNEELFNGYFIFSRVLNWLMYMFFIIGIKWGKPNSSY